MQSANLLPLECYVAREYLNWLGENPHNHRELLAFVAGNMSAYAAVNHPEHANLTDFFLALVFEKEGGSLALVQFMAQGAERAPQVMIGLKS